MLDTADTFCISNINFDLDVALITPGGVPGVPDEPVVQASGCISAVADNEHGMVDKTPICISQIITIPAVVCVDDTARIGVDVRIIGRKNDGNRL